jgi:hypothetical protein
MVLKLGGWAVSCQLLSVKTGIVTKHIHVPRTLTLAPTKQWERDIRFGTCNVRSLYRSDSLTTAARELTIYKLDLVGVQEVKWSKGGTIKIG